MGHNDNQYRLPVIVLSLESHFFNLQAFNHIFLFALSKMFQTNFPFYSLIVALIFLLKNLTTFVVRGCNFGEPVQLTVSIVQFFSLTFI